MTDSAIPNKLDNRRRRLDDLFENQPFLSATMKAAFLHDAILATGSAPVASCSDWRTDDLTHRISRSRSASGQEGTSVPYQPDSARWEQADAAPQVRQRVEWQDVLTAQEAASYLRVGRTTLRNLTRDGLPVVKLGSRLRYRKAAILEWMEAQEGQKP